MALYAEPLPADPVQKLFELSGDMLGTASADGYFTRLNPAWERTLGWTADELMAKPFISFVHPDDVEMTLEHAALLYGGRSSLDDVFVNRYRTRDGDHRSLEWTTTREGGELYFVAKDVTDRGLAKTEQERAARVKAQQLALSSFGLREVAGVDALLQDAADVLLSALGGDMAAIFEHTGVGEAIVRAEAGEPVPAPPIPATASSRRSFELVRNSGHPLLSPDIRSDERFDGPVLQQLGMVSLVAAPIGSGSEGFGFLGAMSRREAAFSEDDLAFVQSVANALSAAVDREQALARVERAEVRMVNLWELSLDPLAVFASDGTFLETNAAWERILGWTREDLLGKSAREFIHPDDLDATVVTAGPTALLESSVPEVVNRYRAKDGSWRRLLWSVHTAPDGDIYAVAKDITEMYREREQLNEAQRIARIGSWETDLVSGQFTASETLGSMLELDSLDPAFDDVFARVHPDDRARVRAKFAERTVDPAPTEFRAVRADGSVRMFSSEAEAVTVDGQTTLIRGMIQDVTEERTRELALQRSEERFRQGFENAPIGMSLVDPASGRYVRVNQAFCRFLGRSADELVGLRTTDVTHPDSVEADKRALKGLAAGELTGHVTEKRYVRPDGSVVWGALSVSVALAADGSIDVFFGQVMDITESKEREAEVNAQLAEVAWLGEIKQAFEEGRFELHAQPIVDVATSEVINHELLIRMRDHDGELVPPGDFLPAAEKYGPIRDIDRWVISRAAEIAADGMDVAVNVSGVSLGDPSLATHIEDELERTGADPSRVVFEITETALIEAGEGAVQLTQQIRKLGCRFALDDFGTGYGTLQHLKTLPLDFLKIDVEFVRGAVASAEDRHLIAAVVSLARGFGLRTVGEGVEDQETLELLAEMGVDYAQGFHLGRPAPLDT